MNRFLIKFRAFVVCLFVLTFSCKDSITDFSNWGNDAEINNLSGQYHFLEKEGIKIYLPKQYERINTYDYKNYADSLGKNYAYNFNIHQPEKALYKESNSYSYINKSNLSTYTVTVLPQQTFVEADAKNLLNTIRNYQDIAAGKDKVNFKKETAKFFDNRGIQIFKTVYKVENKKLKTNIFHYSYFISNKNHTVFINLTTPEVFENFDQYLQKMIL